VDTVLKRYRMAHRCKQLYYQNENNCMYKTANRKNTKKHFVHKRYTYWVQGLQAISVRIITTVNKTITIMMLFNKNKQLSTFINDTTKQRYVIKKRKKGNCQFGPKILRLFVTTIASFASRHL